MTFSKGHVQNALKKLQHLGIHLPTPTDNFMQLFISWSHWEDSSRSLTPRRHNFNY